MTQKKADIPDAVCTESDSLTKQSRRFFHCGLIKSVTKWSIKNTRGGALEEKFGVIHCKFDKEVFQRSVAVDCPKVLTSVISLS